MALNFRTDSLGLWGAGLGRNLMPEEVDANFWFLYSLYLAVHDHVEANTVSVSNITLHGDQLLFEMSDGSFMGPFTIPSTLWRPRGAWTAATTYFAMDLVSSGGILYFVNLDHVSDASFDAGRQIGGQDVYSVLLEPANPVLPAGGTTGQILRKASNVDYETLWDDNKLADLTDFSKPSPLVANSVVYWNGSFFTATQYLKEQQLLQLKVQTVASAGGVLTVDRSAGEIVNVSLTENITSVVVNNWAAAGYLGKVVFKFTNTAAFTVALSVVDKWNNNFAFSMSLGSGKIDRALASSDDGGATVLGDVVGQLYGG